MRVAKYDEQYTRRENIRIFNLEIESDQPLVDGVTEFLNEVAQFEYKSAQSLVEGEGPPVPYEFKTSDISVCHRLGKPPAEGVTDCRAIIVSFVRHQTVYAIFKHKKET